MFLSNSPSAQAFWPFATANAQGTGVSAPSASTPLLAAAINSDPNPNKLVPAPSLSGGTALVADAGPSGTYADVGDAAQSDQISLYIVREGDSLSQIASMFGVSVNTIVWANNLGPSKAIHPGQTLVILPVSGVEHVVVKGDTIASIAKKFGGDVNDIADFNGLDASAPLVAGTTVIIPNGEIAAVAVTPVKRPTSGGKVPANPFRASASGPEIDGYYSNPVPGARLTNGLHGKNAVDLAIARGTPIHASCPGTVIIARNNGGWNGGYGNYVVIACGNGTQVLSAHASRLTAQVGDGVGRDDIVGYVGMTGEATGAHDHYEVRGAENPFATCPVGGVCQPK